MRLFRLAPRPRRPTQVPPPLYMQCRTTDNTCGGVPPRRLTEPAFQRLGHNQRQPTPSAGSHNQDLSAKGRHARVTPATRSLRNTSGRPSDRVPVANAPANLPRLPEIQAASSPTNPNNMGQPGRPGHRAGMGRNRFYFLSFRAAPNPPAERGMLSCEPSAAQACARRLSSTSLPRPIRGATSSSSEAD